VTGAVVVVLAGSMGIARVISSTPDPGGRIDLLTSEWHGGYGSALTGTLTVTDSCVFVLTETGPVDVAWPDGYAAYVVDGEVEIRANDAPMAHQGDQVRAGGGFLPSDNVFLHGSPCADTLVPRAFVIQSSISVEEPAK